MGEPVRRPARAAGPRTVDRALQTISRCPGSPEEWEGEGAGRRHNWDSGRAGRRSRGAAPDTQDNASRVRTCLPACGNDAGFAAVRGTDLVAWRGRADAGGDPLPALALALALGADRREPAAKIDLAARRDL